MKIAFIRSIEVQQAAPDLTALENLFSDRGIQARLLYTDGDCGPDDFPGDAEKLRRDSSCEDVLERVLAWGADGVISLSIPDENALRDAVVGEALRRQGVPTVMHNVETTCRLSNKWTTKETVAGYGLSTPDGIFVDGDLLNGRGLPVLAYRDYVDGIARGLGFPLLAKPLWDCLANGIRYIEDADAWSAYLASPSDGNVTLEECLSGELCSVEILGRDGRYVVQPLVWKGVTGGRPEFLFGQLRYSAPRSAAERDFAPVAERLTRLCAALDVNGALEVEMIYRAGAYHIIEINPRVSGSTSLSIAASGLNTYACLVDMLMGLWTPERTSGLGNRRRLALQFPTRPLDEVTTRSATVELDVVRASTFHIDGRTHANMVITVEEKDCVRVMSALSNLCEQFDLLEPSVLAEIGALLARTADEVSNAAAKRSLTNATADIVGLPSAARAA